MDNNKKNNSTLDEILEEDIATSRKKKGKGCFVRFLLILTLLVLFFFGFLYVTQYLADLEAEARVRAILTVNAGSGAEAPAVEPTGEAVEEIIPTETPDAELERTATIAAQLTSVADFQLTVTPTE
jgi:hypothetical protein